MIVHLFNSSSVSGPERLVLPSLIRFQEPHLIVNLVEERIGRLRASDPLGDFSRSLKLSYRSVRVKKRWDPEAIGQLQALLESEAPNVVHAHAVKASVYLREASRNFARKFPIVSTHHGVHGLPDFKTRVYEWLYRKRYLNTFDRVLAVSTPDYKFLLDSGVGKERVRLHLNGADGRLVSAEDRPEVSRSIRAGWLPAQEGRDELFLFGVVGRLSAEKDHERILKVLSILNEKPCEHHWRCLVFGMGPLEKRLKDESVRLGLENRMVWMGYRQGVGNELVGLDLLLSFSKAEGLPINVIEAGWGWHPCDGDLGGRHSGSYPRRSVRSTIAARRVCERIGRFAAKSFY